MRIERVLIMLAVIGIVCKLFMFPLSGIYLSIAIGLLVIMYFFFAFYFFSVDTIKQQNLALSIISGIVLSPVLAGVLFKFQHWPFAGLLTFYGVIIGFIMICVIYAVKKTSTREGLRVYYNRMLTRAVTLWLISFVLFLTPMRYIIRMEYRNDPEGAKLIENAYYHPENDEYQKAIDQYYQQGHK